MRANKSREQTKKSREQGKNGQKQPGTGNNRSKTAGNREQIAKNSRVQGTWYPPIRASRREELWQNLYVPMSLGEY